MNLVKCPNNHMYNADHFPSCPVCGNKKLHGEKPSADQRGKKTDTVEQSIEFMEAVVDKKPCGWLVCIEGSEYGHEFPIHKGTNTIGRGANMDITLANDIEVSRYIHAKINYDPARIEYSISVGENVNPIEVNGTRIIDIATLKDRDRIKLGSMTFIFIALCGRDFSWKE